ncbi:MAG: hypothetical protein WEA09_05075 [Gemmatimonadota bacterium]
MSNFPWIRHPFRDPSGLEAEPLQVDVGPLRIRTRLRSSELHVHQSRPSAGQKPGASPEVAGRLDEEPTVGWSRWALPGEVTHLRLDPALPDRPVVVTPHEPFRLLDGAEARIFVRVPLWARVAVEPGSSHLLDTPSVIMSDTWWGDPMDGELCYWLATSARRAVEAHHFEPQLAITVLHMDNDSGQDLLVDRLALRVNHLSLFRRGYEIWSEETRVRYQGDDEGSLVEMTGRPPKEATGAEKLAPARTPAPRGIRARTFARLKAISSVGTG